MLKLINYLSFNCYHALIKKQTTLIRSDSLNFKSGKSAHKLHEDQLTCKSAQVACYSTVFQMQKLCHWTALRPYLSLSSQVLNLSAVLETKYKFSQTISHGLQYPGYCLRTACHRFVIMREGWGRHPWARSPVSGSTPLPRPMSTLLEERRYCWLIRLTLEGPGSSDTV